MKPIATRSVFLTAWCFFAIATAIGLLLRTQMLWPIPGMNYAFVLHAHSHTALLGWIYNGFFALALKFFVWPQERQRFATLFLVTQVATVGMLLTFPFQGYALESIAFSSLHVVCSAVFAWKLLRSNRAVAAARLALAWAFTFMFLSAAGPLALGPMAAMDMRGTPWYSMAIYFYLHFQYNGWFVFFLLAVLWQWQQRATDGSLGSGRAACCAVHCLAAGCLVTLFLSALWMNPPGWVFLTSLGGATLQCVGCICLWWALRGRSRAFDQRIAGWLARVSAAVFLLKVVLQLLASWPALMPLVTQRMVVIGFLHMVFLAVVTPALLAAAIQAGWMRLRSSSVAGLSLLCVGSLATELVLFLTPTAGLFHWLPMLPRIPEALAAAGAMILAGILLILPSLTSHLTLGDAGYRKIDSELTHG